MEEANVQEVEEHEEGNVQEVKEHGGEGYQQEDSFTAGLLSLSLPLPNSPEATASCQDNSLFLDGIILDGVTPASPTQLNTSFFCNSDGDEMSCVGEMMESSFTFEGGIEVDDAAGIQEWGGEVDDAPGVQATEGGVAEERMMTQEEEGEIDMKDCDSVIEGCSFTVDNEEGGDNEPLLRSVPISSRPLFYVNGEKLLPLTAEASTYCYSFKEDKGMYSTCVY